MTLTASETSITYTDNESNGNDYISLKPMRLKVEIESVVFNNPLTIVNWNDGTKTIVRASGDKFNEEFGLAMAISRKFLNGNRSKFKRILEGAKRQVKKKK